MRLAPGTYLGDTLRRTCGGGLWLTLSGYPPGLVEPWHVHSHPSLFVLLAGRQRDYSRRSAFDQPAWTPVFHPSTELHSGAVGPGGMLGLNVEFAPRWLESHALRERDLGGYQPLDGVRHRLASMRLLGLAFAGTTAEGADLDGQVLELLDPLVHIPRTTARGPAPRWLRRAEDFLHDGFRVPLSLRTVAAEAGVHPVHFARVFRRHHGCAVSEYVRALRLVEAGRLMLEQGRSLARAAVVAGFSDQPHLCRSFARALGFSPGALRAAARPPRR